MQISAKMLGHAKMTYEYLCGYSWLLHNIFLQILADMLTGRKSSKYDKILIPSSSKIWIFQDWYKIKFYNSDDYIGLNGCDLKNCGYCWNSGQFGFMNIDN